MASPKTESETEHRKKLETENVEIETIIEKLETENVEIETIIEKLETENVEIENTIKNWKLK